MSFNCTLCQKTDEWLITSRFCSKCRRIKHLLNLYGDDVYTTLEEVLVRTEKQQTNKIKTSIKPTIERTLTRSQVVDKKKNIIIQPTCSK